MYISQHIFIPEHQFHRFIYIFNIYNYIYFILEGRSQKLGGEDRELIM